MRYRKLYGIFVEHGGIYYARTIKGMHERGEGRLYHPTSMLKGGFLVRISAQKLPIPITITKIDMKLSKFFFTQSPSTSQREVHNA